MSTEQTVSMRKISLPSQQVAPLVTALAEQCVSDGTGYRLELYNPRRCQWQACAYVSADGFCAATAVRAFADEAFDQLAAAGTLPHSPANPDEAMSREDFALNVASVARFRRAEEI